MWLRFIVLLPGAIAAVFCQSHVKVFVSVLFIVWQFCSCRGAAVGTEWGQWGGKGLLQQLVLWEMWGAWGGSDLCSEHSKTYTRAMAFLPFRLFRPNYI